MNYLNDLRKTNEKRVDVLAHFQKKLQEAREKEQSNKTSSKGKLNKEEKKWMDNYLINYGLLSNGQITYEEFLQRSITEEVELSEIQL